MPFAIIVLLLALADQGPQAPALHESVVVSAAAEPVPFDSAARTVWVLTRAEIARLPVRSLEDLLRFASSVDVRARGPYVQADLSIRGANFGQTLVLIDGQRINDAQSGHHNLDIPLTLDDVERVEVLLGAGSSLYGADAFGGTVNIITRTAATPARGGLVAGEYGLVGARGGIGLAGRGVEQAFSVDGVRSSGFMDDRDFRTFAVSSRTRLGRATRVLVGHVRKDFGANGFYGPAPSREETDQTIVSADRTLTMASWRTSLQAMYRTHGDSFLYDRRVPNQTPNLHRTHAAGVVLKTSRTLGTRTRASVGAELGSDWIRSSNLGDHVSRRASIFVEAQQRVTERLILYPGLRYDTYSRFGDAWSPSLAAHVSVRPGVSLRASAGHAFRIPTFTELYYRDPNHLARPTLTPERGWSAEAGADWVIGPRLLARGTAFVRRDRDVIDWTRPSDREPWRTTNIRRVRTVGVELGARRLIGTTGSLDVQYTRLDTDANALDGLLSKYVLEYAPHALVVSGSQQVWRGVGLGGRVGWTHRNDGRSYAVADVKASRPMGRLALVVEAANLFDTHYEEIKGVVMPGRWVSAGLSVAMGR